MTLTDSPESRPLGYARVSTRGQSLEVQLAGLAAAGVATANTFAEKKSGKAGSARPQWEDVRSRLRPGDTLVVSKLDRTGRDTREIMKTAWSLQDLGAKLEILTGPPAGVYDPKGMGKIFFAMLAGFAEMAREMRTASGGGDLLIVLPGGLSPSMPDLVQTSSFQRRFAKSSAPSPSSDMVHFPRSGWMLMVL